MDSTEAFIFEWEDGFEPTNTGFADRPLEPLGHSHILVGAVGLEPTMSEDGRVTVSCTSRYATPQFICAQAEGLDVCQVSIEAEAERFDLSESFWGSAP